MYAVEPGRRVELGISWRAIFVGVVVGLSTQFLLTLLGEAVGLTRLERSSGRAAGGGFGTGLWALAVAVVAWFVGAYVCAWASGCLERSAGVVHGITAWGIGLFLVLFFAGGSAPDSLSAGFGLIRQRPQAVSVARPEPPRVRQVAGGEFEDEAPDDLREDAKEAARDAWEAFATAGLSFAAAALGGASGALRLQRKVERTTRSLRRPTPPFMTPRPT